MQCQKQKFTEMLVFPSLFYYTFMNEGWYELLYAVKLTYNSFA